jgi:preprotein translocase subunit SecD
MKRPLSITIGALSLLLVACGSASKLTYTATLRAPDASRTLFLVEATERVLTRRLAAANVQNAKVSAVPSGPTTATVNLDVPNTNAKEAAMRILAEPFTFDIRLQKEESPKETSSAASDNWEPPTITGEDLDWIEAVGDSSTGIVSVELTFTKEGREKLVNLFKGHKGRDVGIFVRDLLVSKLKIQQETVEDRITISGIPNAKVAQIFAEDVIVGLRVSFAPAQ